MPHPTRSPGYYSASTTRWRCPHCPKVCKSKGGRLRHVRQKHADIPDQHCDVLELPLPETEPAQQNALQSELSSPITVHRSIHTQERTCSGSGLPAFDMSPNADYASLPNSDPVLHDIPMDGSPISQFSQPLNNVISDPEDSDVQVPAFDSVIYHPTMTGE